MLETVATQKPVLIEFFGVPGCGKSTVCAGQIVHMPFLVRRDVSDRWKSLQPHRKLHLVSQSARDYPLSRAALSLARAIGIRRRDPIRRLLRLAVMKQVLNSIRTPLLMDQGALQNVWSICVGSDCMAPDTVKVSTFLRHLWSDKAVSIIALQIPPEVSADRICKRVNGDSRLDGLSKAEIVAKLKEVQPLSRLLLRAAAEAGAHVDTLNANRPIDTVRQAGYEAVERIVS